MLLVRDEWVGSGHDMYYKGSRVLFLTPSGTEKLVLYLDTTDPEVLRTTGTGTPELFSVKSMLPRTAMRTEERYTSSKSFVLRFVRYFFLICLSFL